MEQENLKPIDRKDALEVINTEIKSIQDAQSKNGINHWALFAALGSFFWLFTSELEAPNVYSLKNSLIIFILISFSIDQYKILHQILFNEFNFKNIPNYKLQNPERRKKYFLIPWLESASWAASLLLLRNEMPVHTFLPFFIYSISFLIFSLPVIFFISKIKEFIPPFDRSPIRHKITNLILGAYQIIFYGIAIIGIYSLVFFCFYVYPKIGEFTHSDWRIGALIFGTLFVLNNLVSITDTSTLDSLKDIYQKLTLGLIEPEAAIGRMKIEVAGLTARELFQHNILEKFMIHLRAFEFLLQEQKTIFHSLKELVAKGDPSADELKIVETKISEFCVEKNKLLEAVKIFQKEVISIRSLFLVYKKLHLIDHQTIEEIDETLKKEILRIQGIETQLLNTIKTEVMPAINNYLTQNKIHLSEENRKMLPS